VQPRIFHITTAAELAAADAGGRALAPASLASQGFAHASYRHQLVPVANAIFGGADELVAVELEPARLSAPVRAEPPDPAMPPVDTQSLFPHVYGPIDLDAVVARHVMRRGAAGFELPAPLRAQEDAVAGEIGALLAAYDWYDHPEGPRFVETHRDDHRTNGHWLFTLGAISAFHRVHDSDELWLVHAGRITVHVIDDAGEHRAHALGLDVAGGERPVLSVPRGALQAAELPPGTPYAFGSNVCAPPFTFERSFELCARDDLVAALPQHRDLIVRLTHQEAP
jgi:predicted cupin superfamily sugar epimerase/uncharacterized protein (DUF952 family)